MSLGAFSVSLAVKDLATSIAFYEQLGFEHAGGDSSSGWAILRCGSATIGLFSGMFEENIMTFNPGWSSDASALEQFEDVREIQARLQARGLSFEHTADPEGQGPAHCILKDPDGNTIMLDQHVPRPGGAGA